MRVTDTTRSLGLVVSGWHGARRTWLGQPARRARRKQHVPPGWLQDANAPPAPARCQVCRGTAVTLVAPTAGMEEIANPFMQQDDGDE